MNLSNLLKLFSDKLCNKLYVKKLSPNDNSKNQVYFGGSFDVLNILPITEVFSDNEGDWKRTRFKTKLNFFWSNEEGELNQAPDAQLILYPKYPEVRFSGFLKGAKGAPSDIMSSRIDSRLLFLGVTTNNKIIGFVTLPNTNIANEFLALNNLNEIGIFKEITLINGKIELAPKIKLLSELRRIHMLGWIDAKRLDSLKKILPCTSTNCGGYTLEAELGIPPNSYSEPDYLGWEVKQFGVKAFSKFNSQIITLMTPEPTNGFYVENGVEEFIRKYGYEDKLGREARINFGGIYKNEILTKSTNLKLIINGYDSELGKITNTDGYIGLLDKEDRIASSWSFVSLLKHWNTKHANACYVPSLNRKSEELYPFSKQQYHYGSKIILGSSTDFSLLLKQIFLGNVYYDPGIKLELAIEGIRKQNIKRRSQFRIKSSNLSSLYKMNEIVDINTEF